MTYPRPDYDTLRSRIAADLAAMPAVLRGPLSAAWARACHSQHGHLEWIDAQCSPLTCELERLYDWSALYGVDRLLPTAATGAALATGIPGTQVLAGALLRSQNGLDYTVLAAVVLGAGSTPVSVRCASTGSAGNLTAGQLTLIDPIPGCDSALVIGHDGLSGGAEDEAVDAWRARVADEWQVVVTRGTRSGKPDDYRAWARRAHPSVTTALVQPHVLGLGTVVVRPICNGLPDRQPSQAVIDAVAAFFATIVPATADWRVVAPIRRGVEVAIHLMPGFDSADNRTAITAALGALVLAEASEESVLAVAEVDAAIASVTTQYTRLAPAVDLVAAPGEVFVLDPVVWS